jgi:hypothetical protein
MVVQDRYHILVTRDNPTLPQGIPVHRIKVTQPAKVGIGIINRFRTQQVFVDLEC